MSKFPFPVIASIPLVLWILPFTGKFVPSVFPKALFVTQGGFPSIKILLSGFSFTIS